MKASGRHQWDGMICCNVVSGKLVAPVALKVEFSKHRVVLQVDVHGTRGNEINRGVKNVCSICHGLQRRKERQF